MESTDPLLGLVELRTAELRKALAELEETRAWLREQGSEVLRLAEKGSLDRTLQRTFAYRLSARSFLLESYLHNHEANFGEVSP